MERRDTHIGGTTALGTARRARGRAASHPSPPPVAASPPLLSSTAQSSNDTGWRPSPVCGLSPAQTSTSCPTSSRTSRRASACRSSARRRQSPTTTRPPCCSTPTTSASACTSTCSSVRSSGCRNDAAPPTAASASSRCTSSSKTGKKPRLVIDLSRNLNDHLEYEYFTYSCVDDAVEASHPGCWYGKLDLSNCFLSFPLHPSVRKYFCFRFEGSCTSSLTCRSASAPLLASARSCCRSSTSLWLSSASATSATSTTSSSSADTSRHGPPAAARADGHPPVRPRRQPGQDGGPAQSLSFLGVQLDSVAQTVSCTPARVEELTALLRSLLRQRVITRGHAASLIGKLSFAAQVLPGARPFMRRMLDALHRCKSRRHSTPIRIDPGFRDDLRFWAQQLHHWNGRQQWRSSRAPPFVFASDASLRGFGFYLESTPTPCDSLHCRGLRCSEFVDLWLFRKLHGPCSVWLVWQLQHGLPHISIASLLCTCLLSVRCVCC